MTAAPGEAERVVTALIDAWQRWDVEAMVALSTEDIDFTLPRNNLEGGSYVGHDGVRRAIADARETWLGIRIEVRERREEGNCVLMKFVGFTTSHHGLTVEYDGNYVIEMRDGRIAVAHIYLDDAEAEAAFKQAARADGEAG